MIINGDKIAEVIIKELMGEAVPQKFLAVFVMEEDKRSFGFVNKKAKLATKLGVDFRIYKIPENMDQEGIEQEVLEVAKNRTCGGIVIQLPLRKNLNRDDVLNLIPMREDVDVLSERALGAFYNGRSWVKPPAVNVVERILKKTGFMSNIKELRVAIVGVGFLTGKPILTWFLGQVKELIIFDKGSDFKMLNKADLVISGVGESGIIKPVNLKKGAGFIDFGYSKNKKITGDLDVSNKKELKKLKFYTPTPGGTGPILVAELFDNFYKLAD